MGEFADQEFINGWRAYDSGTIDDEGITCKYCGQDYLLWRQLKTGEWRLFDGAGVIHLCRTNQKPRRKP